MSVDNMANLGLVVLSLSLFAGLAFAERVRYDNYRVYQVIARTSKDVQYIRELANKSDRLEVFDSVIKPGRNVSILVSPQKQRDFMTYLDQREVFYELVVRNFQDVLDAEMREFRSRSTTYDWKGYHTLEENYEWLRSMARQFPNVVELVVGGKSFEGRDILGVKVSFKAGNKGIFMEGGIHAREWISPATLTYILNELLTSENEEVRAMAQKYDWYIFPHFNPDGFVYTHTNDRLWRKTRTPGSRCYGADPNRNWGYEWMTIGASADECSGTYGGKSAFSEPETDSMSKYIASLKGKIHTYLSFHSFSQLLLYPYGFTADPSPHDEHLHKIAQATADALYRRYATKYEYGSTYLAIYPAAGSSVDWAYGDQGIPIAYTYELRPASSFNGFILPSAQIIPTGEETLDSLIGLTKEAARLGYL